MSTIPEHVREFVAEQPVGVLATYRADGSARQTVVDHLLDGTDEAAAAIDRVILEIAVERAYGYRYLQEA